MTTKITGNLIRRSDKRDIISRAWPRLEEFLSENGFTFSQNYISQGSLSTMIRKYDGHSVEEMGRGEVFSDLYDSTKISPEGAEMLKKIKNDIIESRAKFISKINNFGYDSVRISGELYGASYRVRGESIPLIYVDKTRNESDSHVLLTVDSANGIKSHEFDEGKYCSDEKRITDRITDASNLVVTVRANAEMEEKIRGLYREARKRK